MKEARYRTIVADPPWDYSDGRPGWSWRNGRPSGIDRPFDYGFMSLGQIADLGVTRVIDRDAHLYLWTTQRYIRDAFWIADAWRFRVSCVLVWCKAPTGFNVGGTYMNSVEFVLFCRRGTLKAKTKMPTQWFQWPRTEHSNKPDAFLDMVEQVSPGPYLELFARRQRLGWDTWGNEALEHVAMGV